MKKTKRIMAVLLTLCLCFGALSTGKFALQTKAATSLNDWQGYWGEPVVDGEGVRVSTNATYLNALTPDYIKFDVVIGAMDSNSHDWMKFGLGKVKADMDANGEIYVRIYNVDNKLEMSLLHGATVIESYNTEFKVGDNLSFVVKKQANAEAWDILVNDVKLFTNTKSFINADGKTYLGFASWADGADEDRATDLYYTVNSVVNSESITGPDEEQGTSLSDWQGYWGEPVVDGKGVRVSTNATYLNALTPDYIKFNIVIGALDSNSQDWMKFGLGKVKADMDANGEVYVRIYNVNDKLEMSLLHGATIIESYNTEFKVGDSLSFVIKKQADAEAWDISVNGVDLFTNTKSFTNADGKTYLGLASWADGADEDRATDLYYTINSVMNSENGTGTGEDTGSGEDIGTGEGTGSGEDTGTGEDTGSNEGTGEGEGSNTEDKEPTYSTITKKVKKNVAVGLNAWEHYWADPNAGGFAPSAAGNGVKIITNATHKTALNPEYVEFTLKIGNLKADSTDWIKFGFGDTTKDYDKWAGISFVLRNCGGKLGVEGLRPSVFNGIELDNVSVYDTLKFVFEKQDNGVWRLSVNGTKIADLTDITAADFCDENGKTHLGFASWADVSDGTKRTDKLHYNISALSHMTTVTVTVDENGNEVQGPLTGDNTHSIIWVGCMVVALTTGVVVYKKKERRA